MKLAKNSFKTELSAGLLSAGFTRHDLAPDSIAHHTRLDRTHRHIKAISNVFDNDEIQNREKTIRIYSMDATHENMPFL
jgi:endonuclease YncB( thermonuclease family)